VSFEEIMRRLRERTPEERVVMAAETELILAEGRLLDRLGERLREDLEAGEKE
jgi:hypothetical protein